MRNLMNTTRHPCLFLPSEYTGIGLSEMLAHSPVQGKERKTPSTKVKCRCAAHFAFSFMDLILSPSYQSSLFFFTLAVNLFHTLYHTYIAFSHHMLWSHNILNFFFFNFHAVWFTFLLSSSMGFVTMSWIILYSIITNSFTIMKNSERIIHLFNPPPFPWTPGKWYCYCYLYEKLDFFPGCCISEIIQYV